MFGETIPNYALAVAIAVGAIGVIEGLNLIVNYGLGDGLGGLTTMLGLILIGVGYYGFLNKP
jgi:hypothetical protein